eukprot:6634756-Karenia_brevis.AAC.1
MEGEGKRWGGSGGGRRGNGGTTHCVACSASEWACAFCRFWRVAAVWTQIGAHVEFLDIYATTWG